MSQYVECTQGPCWDEYIYVGPKPKIRGSCVKKNSICKKKRHKCNKKISCIKNKKNKYDIDEYHKCLKESNKKYENKKLKLCPRGYCTAKQVYNVYPSAYANGYATSVCKGDKSDLLGNKQEDLSYIGNYIGTKNKNNLNRWYKEQWVNVCEKGDGPGGYAVCGTGKGVEDIKNYPYCRAYYKFPGTQVVTAPELTQIEINKMCKNKRSLKQGINKKPTRIMLFKDTKIRVKKNKRKNAIQLAGKNTNFRDECIKIPNKIKRQAILGIKLIDSGYNGGTHTGWNRAEQLAYNDTIDIHSLAEMRTWFSRHGPDAKNGGTSYPGYLKWLSDGKPFTGKGKNNYRGAVSWLIWGGNATYSWLKTNKIRFLLNKYYPKRKKSPLRNNLVI